IVLSVQRVHLVKGGERKAYRRVMNVNEIADYEDYRTVFKWHPTKDEHIPSLNKSVMLSNISERLGVERKELLEEIERRKRILHWMRERNIRSYKDVAAIIAEYYARPEQIYAKVLAGEEVKALAAPRSP
ncbi:MAG: protein kinase, partial [Candidatus Bathyarchaeia archaeon]